MTEVSFLPSANTRKRASASREQRWKLSRIYGFPEILRCVVDPYQLRRRSVSIDLRSVHAIRRDLKMSRQSFSISCGKAKNKKIGYVSTLCGIGS